MTMRLEYRGYAGSLQYVEAEKEFSGWILAIPEFVGYSGATHSEAEDAFRRAVDEYCLVPD